MNKFGSSNQANDDCNCPEKSGHIKMSLYMVRDRSLQESVGKSKISNVLVDVLGYTKKQAETAIGFTESRGECLIYSGIEEAVMTYMGVLQSMGVRCQARTEGMLK